MPAPSPADENPQPPLPALTGMPAGVATAVRHALGWLVVGNLAGFYLAMLLLHPTLQLGEWSYGRWAPVHLNAQLYGWTSLPLVAWLLALYEVDRSRVAAWGPAAVWAWTGALGAGVCQWLTGVTSGKIFLDWTGVGLWTLMAALVFLWCVLMAAWQERATTWTAARKYRTLAGLLGLALVPISLVFAASPAVYPPIDRTTGGPTGSSLLGSALVVVGLMLLLPRLMAASRGGGNRRGIWLFFAVSWLGFGVMEAIGGTHHEAHQIGSMVMLLPWVWWLPHDWAGFVWPDGARVWRRAMFGWWGVLVVSGILMYQPGVLDRLKFTHGLVAHSHLAMAGFTTSFCALLLVLLTGRRMGGGASVAVWHVAALVMVVALAVTGWREGADPSWMSTQPQWRELGLAVRALCGGLMLTVSVLWLRERRIV